MTTRLRVTTSVQLEWFTGDGSVNGHATCCRVETTLQTFASKIAGTSDLCDLSHFWHWCDLWNCLFVDFTPVSQGTGKCRDPYYVVEHYHLLLWSLGQPSFWLLRKKGTEMYQSHKD